MSGSLGLGQGALRAVLLGGLAAGAIDIAYAILANLPSVGPVTIFQSVASGLLGRDAYSGGLHTAVLGGVLHFAMTILMAGIFIGAAMKLRGIRHHLLLSGLLYGAVIFFGMRWIVVPLSGFPGDLRTLNLADLIVHVLGVGFVIALFALRFLPRSSIAAPPDEALDPR